MMANAVVKSHKRHVRKLEKTLAYYKRQEMKRLRLISLSLHRLDKMWGSDIFSRTYVPMIVRELSFIKTGR